MGCREPMQMRNHLMESNGIPFAIFPRDVAWNFAWDFWWIQESKPWHPCVLSIQPVYVLIKGPWHPEPTRMTSRVNKHHCSLAPWCGCCYRGCMISIPFCRSFSTGPFCRPFLAGCILGHPECRWQWRGPRRAVCLSLLKFEICIHRIVFSWCRAQLPPCLNY